MLKIMITGRRPKLFGSSINSSKSFIIISVSTLELKKKKMKSSHSVLGVMQKLKTLILHDEKLLE